MTELFKKIGFGCDHAGFVYKEELKKWLGSKGYITKDYGVYNEKSLLDYKCVANLAMGIVLNEVDVGIAICGTGVAVSIVANKTKGIRAALCNDIFTAKKSRQHNDANVLALGSRVIGLEYAKEIVEAWLSAEFEGGRHAERRKYFSFLDDLR